MIESTRVWFILLLRPRCAYRCTIKKDTHTHTFFTATHSPGEPGLAPIAPGLH